MHTRRLLPLLGFAALFASGACVTGGCASPEADDPVVAAYGGVEVRQSAFADEYRRFANVAPVQDGLEARREYAVRMLERAWIAAVADSAGLDARPEVAAHVKRQHDFAMRQAFLTDSLEARIAEPTEADVREAFRRQNSRLRVRQAFANTEAEARALAARLASGESFETVARTSLEAVGIEGASGEMGWVSFNDLDEGPENALFALERGGVSAPVQSLRGWHLFQVLDREETVRLDASAFGSARERLSAELRQRRIDEAGARYLQPLLESHELAVRLEPLRQLWPQIAPYAPANPQEGAADARRVLPGLEPEAITRATPVATVDGRPFTVGQLLDALPGVPAELWSADLRKAVEVAVRDSILTARAQASGADARPEVLRETTAARSTALYYAGLSAALDTLTIDRHVGRFYSLWRQRLISQRATDYAVWTFETEAAARDALRTPEALTFGAAETRRDVAAPGEPGPFGVHSLPVSASGARGVTGPFADGRTWAVVEVTGREDAPIPFAQARAEVLDAMRAEPRSVAHRLLLDRGFDADAATLDDGALQAALPLYSRSDSSPPA